MLKRGTEPAFVEALPADLERVLGFIRRYYEFDGIRFTTRAIKKGLEVLLRDRSIGRVWFIRLGRKDVGYVVLTFGFDLEFGGRQATVTDLYIVDGHRRLGLGAKTLHFVEETCRELGVEALELQVERRNVAAQAFYGKLGFESQDRISLSKRLNVNSQRAAPAATS
jgi:GNAT superfamily N-acetyltransferase